MNKELTLRDIKNKCEVNFDENEVYDLDETISKFILPRLIYFRDNEQGIPSSLIILDEKGNPQNEPEAAQQWRDILNKMINAFWGNFNGPWVDNDEAKEEELTQKRREGFELFAKYFESLWW